MFYIAFIPANHKPYKRKESGNTEQGGEISFYSGHFTGIFIENAFVDIDIIEGKT